MSGCGGCGKCGGCGGSLVNSLLSGLDDVLSIRDSIGAKIHDVFFLTRSWSGKEIGDGKVVEKVVQILPTPQLVEYGHDIRITEGGAVKQGDIILKNISKNSYPNESAIDGNSETKTVEKFYLIDDRLYTVINVKERYLTWDVQIRKCSNQIRYGKG